jgi:DNA helicase-2/ATP-dependent DNA helicase PcrA
MFDAHPHSFLDELNVEQRAAATHSGETLLILAGAGTGKTTTLCARVAWLMGEGVPAERILLLTFTRRAAREMIERARTLAERVAPDAGRIVGGTFHSVAHRMVRVHATSLGLEAGFGVLDAGDAGDLLDLVRQEHGGAESPRRFPRAATMLDIYSRTVNAQTPLTEVLAEFFPWCDEHHQALAEIFRAYGARKRTLGVLDLDDLLLYWRALVTDEAVGPLIADDFDHVLVDEYQDVNGLQVDIVAGMRPLDDADPRGRERRLRTGSCGVPEGAVDRARGRHSARADISARRARAGHRGLRARHGFPGGRDGTARAGRSIPH